MASNTFDINLVVFKNYITNDHPLTKSNLHLHTGHVQDTNTIDTI